MIKVAVVDIETSGLEEHHEINQIACVVFNRETIIETFERKLHFDVSKAEPKALEVMHYDPDVWKREAIDPFVGLVEFIEFLSKHTEKAHLSNKGWHGHFIPVMGHHIWRFDIPKLYAMAEAWELYLPLWPHPLDTYQLAAWQFFLHADKLKRSFPMNLRLETLAEWFGIRYDRPHDALEDCIANIKVARALIAYFKDLEKGQRS